MARLLSDLLSESAIKFPAKPAVIDGDKSISYQELDELSNKVAVSLKNQGVGPRDLVGLYMQKNLISVVAIHGILKAGAGYVPVDTNAPPRLVSYYIENSEITCLFSSASLLKMLAQCSLENSRLKTLILQEDQVLDAPELPCDILSWNQFLEMSNGEVPENPGIDANIAYILYTSGSTGVPKGVITTHRNALSFVNSSWLEYGVTHEDKVANPAPLKFGISIFDIFVSIKAGATLVIIPPYLMNFPLQLAEWIEMNHITTWFSVPFVLSRMVLDGEMQRFKFKNLKTVFFAGEVFPVKYLSRLMQLIPHASYFNIYGTTETNILTHFKVPELDPERDGPVPIGKAISNLEVFALKSTGEVVTKAGDEGEICVRGAMVAMGYWKNLKKTDKSFIQNPLNKNYREIIYKTGDLVRIDSEGNFHFLGRNGLMIKSRGYRIETGEIEAALYAHPNIKEAIVVGIPDDLVGNLIKAVLTLNEGQKLDEREIKAFCKDRIPGYMIPEIIEFRDGLPKTSTGKVDRLALVNPK